MNESPSIYSLRDREPIVLQDCGVFEDETNEHLVLLMSYAGTSLIKQLHRYHREVDGKKHEYSFLCCSVLDAYQGGMMIEVH